MIRKELQVMSLANYIYRIKASINLKGQQFCSEDVSMIAKSSKANNFQQEEACLAHIDEFPNGQCLPLPDGISESALFSFLRSVCAVGEPSPEVVQRYCEDHFNRIVFTYGLTKGLKGKCLELGSAPYFITMLLKQFTDLELVLANYFGQRYAGIYRENAERVCPLEISFENPKNHMKEYIKTEFYQFNVESDMYPFSDSEFDVVLFCELIEHMQMDPIYALMEMKRVLKPNGVLILTTPNANRIENIIRMISGSNIYDHYSGYGPYGRHNREYNVHELMTLLEYCGFSIDSISAIDTTNISAWEDPIIKHLEPLLGEKEHSLGKQIFIRAKNTKEARRKRPAFLYANYLPEELENFKLPEKEDVINEPSIAFIGDWHDLELWNSTPTRWIGPDASLHIYSEQNRSTKFCFKVLSFYSQRNLEVRFGEALIAKYEVPTSFINVCEAINLSAGANELRLHVREGCERPCDKPELKNTDSRCLSLAIQEVTFS